VAARKPKQPDPRSIEIEGGNGLSYLRIEETERPGVVRISLGHECVNVFQDREMDVWALCAVLTQVWDTDGFRTLATRAANGASRPEGVPDWCGPIPAKGDPRPGRFVR
jgi:hypothetical protein